MKITSSFAYCVLAILYPFLSVEKRDFCLPRTFTSNPKTCFRRTCVHVRIFFICCHKNAAVRAVHSQTFKSAAAPSDTAAVCKDMWKHDDVRGNEVKRFYQYLKQWYTVSYFSRCPCRQHRLDQFIHGTN